MNYNSPVKISQSKVWSWYITFDGQVYRTPNSAPQNDSSYWIYNKPYLHHDKVVVMVNKKEYSLMKLVLISYAPQYRGKLIVTEPKDGNKFNCSGRNIRVKSYIKHGIDTGYLSRSKPVRVRKKYTKDYYDYRSVRSAAKALAVSYQTILDYMRKSTRPKNSVLDKYFIEYI